MTSFHMANMIVDSDSEDTQAIDPFARPSPLSPKKSTTKSKSKIKRKFKICFEFEANDDATENIIMDLNDDIIRLAANHNAQPIRNQIDINSDESAGERDSHTPITVLKASKLGIYPWRFKIIKGCEAAKWVCYTDLMLAEGGSEAMERFALQGDQHRSAMAAAADRINAMYDD